MRKSAKVCLTTYIYGVKYQNYIPLLLYSCHKAYPEYDVVLFLYDKLDQHVKRSIDTLNLSNKVIIHEEHFNDCPKMSPIKSKAFRWILWDDVFKEYDYLYTVDIDMLYIREPLPLHIQHEKHMRSLGLPISNLQRKVRHNPFHLKTTFKRIESVGFKYLTQYLSNSKIETRTTGLHFVDVREYYKLLTKERRNQYRKDIYSGKLLSYVMNLSDEIFLTKILDDIGIRHSKMALQQSPVDMLDFNEPERLEFRPHHGIHLGLFRNETSKIKGNSSLILASEAYKYYVEKLKTTILMDENFKDLFESLPDDIKVYFQRMLQFYDLEK